MSDSVVEPKPLVRPLGDAVRAALLILIVSCSGIGFVWLRAENALYEGVRAEILQLARSAAVTVDADLHATLRSPEQTGSREHLRALAPLVAFHQVNEDIIYVYTAILQDGRIRFVLGTDYLYDAPYDQFADEPSDPIMTEYKGRDPDFRRALKERIPTANARPVASQVREYLSAYAPIFHRDGRFEGVVGIDMWSDQLDKRLWTIRAGALGGIAGVVLLSLVSGWAVYRSRLRLADSEHLREQVAREAVAARERAETSAEEARSIAAELTIHQNELERLVEQRTREWRSSEARFRGLVEQSAVGVVIGDAQGLSYANPGMAAMLGYDSPAAFLASGQFGGHGLISPTGTAKGHSGQANVSLVEAQRRDGSAALLELHSQAIDPRAGGERIAIVIDVSEREREKAARNAALSAAEELSRLRMEFMANASHELRTPLNGIIGFASLGEQAQDLERARGLFTRLLVPARQLTGIIESLLDFAATEKGALQIDKRPTPLAELLEPLSGECRERAGSRGLGFAEERGQDLPQSVLIDPVRVRQVLDIFLSNAFKFTQRGTVTLLARRDKDALVLGVRDTGVGIDPDYVDRVFTPFEQADGSATRRHGGAGIGLALARSLAEKMGGTIDISSVPGEGTQVLLRLPLAGIRLPEASA